MKRFVLEVPTEGDTHVVNLSQELARRVREVPGEGFFMSLWWGRRRGLLLWYEPGLVKHDFGVLMEKIAVDGKYEHEATWNDDNGHAHCGRRCSGRP